VAAVKRAVLTIRDPKLGVEKYKAFLGKNPSAAARAEAEKELAVWQDRVDRGLVKVGENWVTPSEAAEKQKNAAGVADGAAALIAAKNYAGAEAAVDGALKDAPNNPSLLFLKGVILFKKNQMVPARKAFEQVEASEPGNWAVHNNLGVILFQTRAQMPALAQYDKAMIAEPENQRVLDNVAEALHQLPATAMKNDVVRKVVDRFMAQDALLAEKMKQEKGLMRLGAQWVGADEYSTLQASRKDAEEKIAQYRRDAAELPGQISTIDQDLTIKTNAMKAIVQESSGIDAYGHIVTSQLPQHYYQLKQEVEQMTADRVLKQRRLEQLPRLMSEAQKQLAESQARYSGKQGIVEEMSVKGATTQPGTADKETGRQGDKEKG
jgi:Tfp pilus assembly protein PilF